MADDEVREDDAEGAPERQKAPVGRLRRISFDATGVDLIAETLGAKATLAPFRLPSAAVYQALISGANGRPATLLTLWPSLRRVDAINSSATVVFTGITGVDLVDGVEVVFRRESRETLIVAIGGKIIVRV